MIKLTSDQPVYIAVQVSVSINVWMACDGDSVPTDIEPDLSDSISLGRTIPVHKKLDKSLAIVLNAEDMVERCEDAIGARLMTKLAKNGN
jgi:hypothetical protein